MKKINTKLYTAEDGTQFRFNFTYFSELVNDECVIDGLKTKTVTSILTDISENLFVSFDTVKKWKSGTNAPSDLPSVGKIADYFGVELSDLLIEIENETKKKEKNMKTYMPEKDIELIEKVFSNCAETIYTFAHLETASDDRYDKIRESHTLVDGSALLVSSTTRYNLHRILIEFENQMDYPSLPPRWNQIIGGCSDQNLIIANRTSPFNVDCGEYDPQSYLYYVRSEIILAERLGYLERVKQIPDELAEEVNAFCPTFGTEEDMEELCQRIRKYGHLPLFAQNEDRDFTIDAATLWIDTMVQNLKAVFLNDFPDLIG